MRIRRPASAPSAVTSGAGQKFRVLDVVVFEEEDESRFVGLLQVEAA